VTVERDAVRDAVVTAVAGVVVSVVAAVFLGERYSASVVEVIVATLLGWLPGWLAASAVLRREPRSTTPADRVTLARAALASGSAAAAVLVVADAVPAQTWWLFSLALVTLLLDGVDGWVARRTDTATEAGGLLDMQVDAGFLVVLSLAAAPVVGWWVLLVGAMRYLYVVASWVRPELTTPLPRSRFRVTVAAFQGVALLICLAPATADIVATAVAGGALALLTVSFGSQVVMVERARR
jgi:phosphatidylglycerophosphate synthase